MSIYSYSIALLPVRFCQVVTTLVMSIISAATIAYYLPLTAIALSSDQSWWHKYDYEWSYDCDTSLDGTRDCIHHKRVTLDPEYTARVSTSVLNL